MITSFSKSERSDLLRRYRDAMADYNRALDEWEGSQGDAATASGCLALANENLSQIGSFFQPSNKHRYLVANPMRNRAILRNSSG